MWERLKFTERFSFVNYSKVVHVVVDDQGDKDVTEYEPWSVIIGSYVQTTFFFPSLGMQKKGQHILVWTRYAPGLTSLGTWGMMIFSYPQTWMKC